MDQQAAQPNPSEAAKTPLSNKLPLVAGLILVVIAVLGLLGFWILNSQTKKDSSGKIVTGLSRNVVTIGIATTAFQVFPNSLNETGSTAFNSHIFDGLGKIVNGQIKPDLALSWTNPDKNTWRFHLRKGVTFTNGNKFTATDVKFSIDSALKEEWPDAFNLSTVESVEVVDDFTVDVKTSSPDPVLLNRLAYVSIVSAKQFENIGSELAVGTGPYKFVNGDDKQVILEANKSYFLGRPKIEKVIYKFFPDGTDANLVESLRKGDIDIAVGITDPELARSAESQFQVKSLPDPFITFLWVDTKNESSSVDKVPNPLQNKLVRQAIHKVVKPTEIVKAASRSAEPATQFVTSAIFGFNPSIKRPVNDIEVAKALMAQAGVADGFKLTLDVYERIGAEAKALAIQLGKINITAEVNILSDDEFFNKLSNQEIGNFIIDYGAETFDAGEIFTDVLHTTTGNFGVNNLAGYSNADIDKLADEISTTFDPTTRKKVLQEAMVKAVEQLPIIPLYARDQFFIIRNNFDWTPSAFGNIYVNEISGREVTTSE